MKSAPFKKGFSVLEVVVAASIITISVAGITAGLQFYFKFSQQTTNKTQAAVLLEEGAEALQFLRDKGWDERIVPLSLDTSYHLYWSGTDYVATTTPVSINGRFQRKIIFSAINRDASDSIVTSGGTVDPNSRKVTLSVLLESTGAELLNSQMLIHDVYAN